MSDDRVGSGITPPSGQQFLFDVQPVNFKMRAKIPNRYHVDACRAHAKKSRRISAPALFSTTWRHRAAKITVWLSRRKRNTFRADLSESWAES